MKKYFILAAAALSFAACSSDDEVITKQEAGAEQGQVPVLFDSYVNRATTRAGITGDITVDNIKAATTNFGVFGYYTDNNDYDQFSIPNFMYNQLVKSDNPASHTKWEYTPVKYWPNEYGSTAVSEDYDRVTFFAYSPYVEVKPETGKINTASTTTANPTNVTTGIVGLTSNTGAGDPMVKYVASLDPAATVDLLWGVVGSSETSWVAKEGTQTMTAGLPWMNVKRTASTTNPVKFTFEHALAKLNVTVDAFVDGTSLTNAVAADNKIFIRSITFTGFATKGALNLNNNDMGANKAKWMSFNCLSELETGDEITIYDGRKDGKEGVSAASNEKFTGLNPVLVEEGLFSGTEDGVTNTTVNLFNSATATDPIYVIPTGDKVDVTIVYEVEAEDDNLPTFLADGATHGSRVKNTITKTNVFSGAVLENGKAYTLNLHLGMTSVKFDAVVTPWVDVTPATNVDLPAN